jgi:secreted Zn-dependent insulinase-like peptidase
MFGSLTDYINQRAVEKSTLREGIDQLTYGQFKEELKSFLKTARTVWLVSGNISEEQAKSFVEQRLHVNTLKLEDVLPSQIVNPEGNMRVAFDVKDAKNDNSAFVSYYQANFGNDDLKADLTFRVVSKYLS